jgi:hypothetical protein
MAARSASGSGFYRSLKTHEHRYDLATVTSQLSRVSRSRVKRLGNSLAEYIQSNVPSTVNRREGLSDYRTNPYVLVTSATLMDLTDPQRFAEFLFNNKLYMGLETSFGKSIEEVLVSEYPIGTKKSQRWTDPAEKVAESKALIGLGQEDKAKRRTVSVWREIDKSCIIENRRYLTTIKSGPNCINDTQVEAMKNAIANHHRAWMRMTRKNHPEVKKIDIVIGLTYGTDRTTNNKENQILVKLLEHGFEEEDRIRKPGVLIDSGSRTIRVYRLIGQDFWSFMASPTDPSKTSCAYLEVLLALSDALTNQVGRREFDDNINRKLAQLSDAISKLAFPRRKLPSWIRKEFSDDELFLMATAMTAFFDEGI